MARMTTIRCCQGHGTDLNVVSHFIEAARAHCVRMRCEKFLVFTVVVSREIPTCPAWSASAIARRSATRHPHTPIHTLQVSPSLATTNFVRRQEQLSRAPDFTVSFHKMVRSRSYKETVNPCRFRADVPKRSLRTLITSNLICVNTLRSLYADTVRLRVTANNCPSKTLGICVFRYNRPDARRVYPRRMWREPWWTVIRVHVTNPKLAIEGTGCALSVIAFYSSTLAFGHFRVSLSFTWWYRLFAPTVGGYVSVFPVVTTLTLQKPRFVRDLFSMTFAREIDCLYFVPTFLASKISFAFPPFSLLISKKKESGVKSARICGCLSGNVVVKANLEPMHMRVADDY